MKEGKQGLWFKFEGLRLGLLLVFLITSGLKTLAQNYLETQKKVAEEYSNTPRLFDLKSLQTVIIDTSIKKDTSKFNIAPPLDGRMVSFSIPNKKRIRLVTAANIIGYGAAGYGLYTAWYKDYPQSKFHFFNDNKEWLQVDKVGHMYSAYIESKGSMEVWRWAGLPRKQRIWIGGLSGAVYQTVIETLDGFSADWGWSWGDFTANMLGSGLLIGQEFLWDEQRIDLKFSFHKVNYTEPVLRVRADSLYGKSVLSRMLKDYNGQTYWLSANLKSFFPKSKLPAWLNIAVGYGADGMYGADDNTWKDASGTLINRNDITRYRQWYIAPDINLTKIKTKSKFVKTALFFFNSFKFPLPSIGFSKKGVEWNWVHF